MVSLIIFFVTGQAQDKGLKEHDDYKTALFEIGLSTGLIYLIEEGKTTSGFHAHFTRAITKKKKVIVGLAYEYVFDEHQHHSFGILLGYSPVQDLIVSVAPGFRTLNETLQFTTHFEVTYGFDITKKIHLGPLIEYAYGKNDNHITLGIHIGILINRKHLH